MRRGGKESPNGERGGQDKGNYKDDDEPSSPPQTAGVAQPRRLHELRILQIYFLITTAFLLVAKNNKFCRNSQNSLGRSDRGYLNYTRCFLFCLKCTTIISGWDSAPDPAGGAYSAPPDHRRSHRTGCTGADPTYSTSAMLPSLEVSLTA